MEIISNRESSPSLNNMDGNVVIQHILKYANQSKFINSDVKRIKISKAYIDEKIKTTTRVISESNNEYTNLMKKLSDLEKLNNETIIKLKTSL